MDAATHAHALATLLRHTQPVALGLVKEFFVQEHWDKLPPSWRAPLEALPLEQMAELLLRPALEVSRRKREMMS